MTNKKKEITIHSSAAEYLTYVASTGSNSDSFEMRYEDENIWLTQKMMATLYDVSVSAIMRSVLMGSEYPVMDTPHFLCSKLGNGFIAEQAPLLDAKELDPVLCKQVDVPLCHAPLAAYAVNALDQHQIHLTSEDGLCDLLERRAV